MGKGDKKSKKGKIFMGTFGNKRPRKSAAEIVIPEKKKATPKKEVSTKKPTAKKKTTSKKTTTKKAAAKKK